MKAKSAQTHFPDIRNLNSLTVYSKNFCSIFLVCPLLKHRKVSVSYVLADLPPTANRNNFSFLQVVSNTFRSWDGVCWPHHFTLLGYHFLKVIFSTLTLRFKKEAFPSSFHSMVFTKLYYFQQSTVKDYPQIYKEIYNITHYPRTNLRGGEWCEEGKRCFYKKKIPIQLLNGLCSWAL